MIREFNMTDLSQQNNESTLTSDRKDVYRDCDSSNTPKSRVASSMLQINYSLPVVHKKKFLEVRQPLQIEIVRGAQQGNRQCLEQLARRAKGCLEVYAYRLTRQHELSQEIVQESLLEMLKVIGNLKKPDYFWPWLYGIATNKLRRHYRTEQRYRKADTCGLTSKFSPKQRLSGFEKMVVEEFKQIVSFAMDKLKTQYKAVLTMRCYDDMSYSEIAESLGNSEFGARMLFMRGKRALQKELSRNGFGERQWQSHVWQRTDS